MTETRRHIDGEGKLKEREGGGIERKRHLERVRVGKL